MRVAVILVPIEVVEGPVGRNRPGGKTLICCRANVRCAIPHLLPCLDLPCLAEVPPAAKLIHPHPGRHRLEKVQGRAAGNSQ